MEKSVKSIFAWEYLGENRLKLLMLFFSLHSGEICFLTFVAFNANGV